MPDEPDPEDVKIITLARAARARTGAAEGAAVREADRPTAPLRKGPVPNAPRPRRVAGPDPTPLGNRPLRGVSGGRPRPASRSRPGERSPRTRAGRPQRDRPARRTDPAGRLTASGR